MSRQTMLRRISLLMLVLAAVFVVCALSCPTLGSTILIGPYRFGAEQWRVCYGIYLLVMIGLWIASFFVNKEG